MFRKVVLQIRLEQVSKVKSVFFRKLRINRQEVCFSDFSGRIGFSYTIFRYFLTAINYARGFRYTSMTDLGTLGLTGDGYEVDHIAAARLRGTVGTTADINAVSTGIPVSKQRLEFSDNLEISFRYSTRRVEFNLTSFVLEIKDAITKQDLILPSGAVGRFLSDQQIVNQLPNGVVFVALSTSPVLVRANYSAARIYGFELEKRWQMAKDWTFSGDYTWTRSEDKQTKLPPNIEGGTPPPTARISFRYRPFGKKYWLEFYSTLAQKQNRFSSLDLADRRTGATRSRTQIANFFRRGACVRRLTNNPHGVCVTGDETILLITGETLLQVQNRVFLG